MSQRSLTRWISFAILAGGVLFGAVLQNVLLGLFLGLILAAGYFFAQSAWSRRDVDSDDDDNGARL